MQLYCANETIPDFTLTIQSLCYISKQIKLSFYVPSTNNAVLAPPCLPFTAVLPFQSTFPSTSSGFLNEKEIKTIDNVKA